MPAVRLRDLGHLELGEEVQEGNRVVEDEEVHTIEAAVGVAVPRGARLPPS